MIGRLTSEFEWIGRVGTSSHSETRGELDATVGLSSNVGQRVVDRCIHNGERLSAARGREGDDGSVVQAFSIEKCRIWCAGGIAATSGGRTRCLGLFAVLAVIASVRLLRQLLASGFQHRTGTETAGLEAHQDAVRAAEAEDMCSTHADGLLVAGVSLTEVRLSCRLLCAEDEVLKVCLYWLRCLPRFTH